MATAEENLNEVMKMMDEDVRQVFLAGITDDNREMIQQAFTDENIKSMTSDEKLMLALAMISTDNMFETYEISEEEKLKGHEEKLSPIWDEYDNKAGSERDEAINACVNPHVLATMKTMWEDVDVKKVQEMSSIQGLLPFAVKLAGAYNEKGAEDTGAFDLKNLEDVTSLYITSRIMNEEEVMKSGEISLQSGSMFEGLENGGLIFDAEQSAEYKKSWIKGSLVANDFLLPSSDDLQLAEVYNIGVNHADTFFNSIIPEASENLKYVKDAQTMAVGRFSKIDTSFENLPEEQRKEKMGVIKAHPKEVLALSLIHEKNEEEHKEGVKIFNLEDLKAKLELPEVKELASKIDIKDLNGSLKKLSKDVRSIDDLNKNKGKSIDITSSLIQAKQFDANKQVS